MLLCAAFSPAQTPNLGLTQPPVHSLNWGGDVNADLGILDDIFSISTCNDSTHTVGWNSATKRLTCVTVGGGNMSNSGTPTIGQVAIWQTATSAKGVTNVAFPGDGYFKGRPMVDVRSYGALGDNSTDDITAFASAIAAAANLGTLSGSPQSAKLFIPCGWYMVSSPIIMTKGTNTLSNGVVNIEGESKSCVTIQGTAAFPTGHSIIEWDQGSSVRTLAQTISNLTIIEPAVDNTGGIFYQYTPTNTPVTTANATNERMERLTLRDLEFRGSNLYQPYHIYLQGDCFNCTIENVYWDDVRASGGAFAGANNAYETVGILTDTCYTSSVPSNETCGLLDSRIINIGHIGNRGGYTAAFQGRLNRGVIESAFCNGVRGGFSNSHCFEITNSYQFVMTNISTEGLGGAPEILCTNSVQGKWYNIGIGAPNNSGYGIGDGMDFVGCSQNQVTSTSANNAAQNAWNVQQVITSFSGLTAGSGCSVAPTWASSGGSATQNASGRTTLSGGGVATMIIDIGGNFQGTPTIVFTGTGCTGQAVTPVLTGAGTLYQVKLDSNSHQNTFMDLHQDGVLDVSFSDTTTNYAQSCNQASSACATYFSIGSLPGFAAISPTFVTPALGAATGTSLVLSSTATATRFISNIATGTAPFGVTSTTNVPNLNASSLNGATFAAPGVIGGTTPNNATFTAVNGVIDVTATYLNYTSGGFNDLGQAINAAIALLPASAISPHAGTVTIGPGIFFSSTTIHRPQQVNIRGAGNSTLIVYVPTSGMFAVDGDAAALVSAGWGGWSDLRLQGPGNTNTADAFFIGGDPAGVVSISTNLAPFSSYTNIEIGYFRTGMRFGNNEWDVICSHCLIHENVTGAKIETSATNVGEVLAFNDSVLYNNTTYALYAPAGVFPYYGWSVSGSAFDYNGNGTLAPIVGSIRSVNSHYEQNKGPFWDVSAGGSVTDYGSSIVTVLATPCYATFNAGSGRSTFMAEKALAFATVTAWTCTATRNYYAKAFDNETPSFIPMPVTSENPNAPTISSGFGTSPSVTGSNGASTFRINVGTGGVATTGTISMNETVATGWNCTVNDLTAAAAHVAYNTRQTASTTNTVVVENQTTSSGAAVAWAASDILALNCSAY